MSIYRLNLISRIRSDFVRRALLVLTFPFLFVLNVVIAVASHAVFFILFWWKNNGVLCQSFVKRWYLPNQDQ